MISAEDCFLLLVKMITARIDPVLPYLIFSK